MVPEGNLTITISSYAVRRQRPGLAWIEFRPETGRTHQVRVHAATLGCPILGDAQYGAAEAGPLHLLARSLVLPLYQERPPIVVTAPPPAHMAAALAALGYDEGSCSR